MKIGNKGIAKFAIYIIIFSALIFYSIYFANNLVFATSYYPINTCSFGANGANTCSGGTVTNCNSGTYIPSFTCSGTVQSCITETGSASCGSACTDCNGAGTCASKTCAAGNNYGCASGNYCNSGGSCTVTLANGVSCSDCGLNAECTSGNCANGGASVCCDAGYRCCTQNSDCLTNYGCSSNDCKYAVPQWSNNVTFLSTPTSSVPTSFNITWTQANFSVSKVFIESNWAGSPTNYTATQLAANVYNYNTTILPGTYYWKSYANSSTNVWNSTPQFSFTIPSGLSVTCNAGGPYLKSSVVNVVGNVTYNGAGTSATVTANITNGTIVYLSNTTSSGSGGGYYFSYTSSQVNSLNLGTYGVNVTAVSGSDTYQCNTTLQLLYLQRINCQSKTIYVSGSAVYADTGLPVSVGTVTVGAVGSGITNSTTFSNGQFSIYLNGCFFLGNLYTFSILVADNFNRTSSTQINFIVI